MRSILVMFIMAFPYSLFSQTGVSGYVTDANTNERIPSASVMIGNIGVAANGDGYFIIGNLKAGEYRMVVSVIGYSKFQQKVTVVDGAMQYVDVRLVEDKIQIEEVVVSATRTENRISEIPGRISVITPERLALTVAQTADEYLSLVPGVQVSRSFGLFSHKSSVTMRGLSGNEQARTLVLIDGIPVNKADGGSVNWNLISTCDIERIEVVKGPSSALYGGNAMGGIINVVNRTPIRDLEGSVTIDYGTYNTQGIKAKLAGRLSGNSTGFFYWAANANYRKSDGYVTQSKADRLALGDFVTKSNFNEKALNLRAGFENGNKFQADIDFTVYDDMRGTGEKYIQPDGNSVDHDTYQLRSTARGTIGKFGWNTSFFFLFENYKKVNEWIKDDYTWYDVSSYRKDLGFLSSFNYSLANQSIVAGFDIRSGAVDASDIYFTSTDKVDNLGRMDFYGLYLQDEVTLFGGKVKLIAGLRYDIARFYEGEFTIHGSSAETDFMEQYQFSGLDDEVWGALSPRFSIQYKPNKDLRVYASYSRGFRPSVLDDLCRSGRVRGGFKVANPNLKPEYLDNVELGADYRPVDWIKLSSSLYYSKGTDFLYYVSTGDSIDMGYGNRPIMIRSNISDVRIYGLEFDFSVSPFRYLNLFGSYAYTHPTISDYKSMFDGDPVDLSGNYLTDVPLHSFSIGAFFQHRIVNIGLTGRYIGQKYVNDQNIYDEVVLSDVYPSVFTVDLRLSREFIKRINVSLNIQNIFDKQIYDSKGAVGPGRFITASIGAKF